MKNLRSVLLFVLALLLPHFADSSTEKTRLDCPSGKIEVEESAAVLLPCYVHPQTNVTDHMVDWSRVYIIKKVVFCSQYGGHECNPDLYTSKSMTVDHHDLSRGNLTLQIPSAQLNDSGVYRCYVPYFQSSCKVELSVREKGTLRRDGFNATATPRPKESEAPGSGGGATKSRHWWFTLLSVGVFVITCVVLFTMKRNGRRGSPALNRS